MSGPIRGLHDVEGRLFVVSGRMLYEISQKGVAIPRGTIPGVGRVSMAHNQRGHGHELLVVNGSGGYVYNTGTDNFTIITDPGYPGAGLADFLDGYLMQVEPFGRFLFHSDLADALEYNTLDRFEAETQPDRVVGMIVNHQEVWAFGDRSIDVFGNTGSAQGTFQNKGVSISRGCIAKWSPAIIDNGVAWLGDDRVVYHARGYDPVRISTRAIEVALSECSLTDIRNAFSFVWSDRGHSVYYLTVPNGQTFGYDFSTGLWHRRASWHPERDIGGRWRLADLVRHNGRWIGGDFRDGRLYQLDWDYMLEGCDPLIRERVSPVFHVDGRRFAANSVELTYDTGGSETECAKFPAQPKGPEISGAAPDGNVIEQYPGFAYTVTAGDNPIVKVEIVSGRLPEGISFDSKDAAILPGYATSFGEFTITIRATDSAGLYYDHTDTIRFSSVAYLVFSATTEGLWASADLENWIGKVDFVPSAGNGVYNVAAAGGNLVANVILSEQTETSYFVQAGMPPWGTGFVPVTSSVPTGDFVRSNFYAHGNVVIAWGRSGDHPHYWVSPDAGQTWMEVAGPQGLNPRGFARLDSGRWVCYARTSSTAGHFHCDDDVPQEWVASGSVSGPIAEGSSNCLASDGGRAYWVNNGRTVFMSEDGITWTQVSIQAAFARPATPHLFACSDGTLIAYGNNGLGRIARSSNNGATWDEVVFEPGGGDMMLVTEGGGLLLGSVNHAAFYSSSDMGQTWTRHEAPFSGYGNQSTIIAVDMSK